MRTLLSKKSVGPVLLVLVLAGCSSINTSQPVRVDGTSWTVEHYAGITPLAGTGIQLSFADGRLSGNAGCNSFDGSYAIDGDQIMISELMRTLMACPVPDGVMKQEQDFMDALQATSRLELHNNKLVLKSDDGVSILLSPLPQ
ncbi:MAG: META domain-containing protein [Anaerolineales bacterium]